MDEYDTEAAQQQSESRSKQERDVAISDTKWLMKDKRGRRLMWRWLGRCRVFQLSYTGNSQTFFNEGQRNVGLRFLDEIMTHCPEDYVLMMQENGKP